jgi:predicted membrane channel-forming protein YqfA (hemolysin III family)
MEKKFAVSLFYIILLCITILGTFGMFYLLVSESKPPILTTGLSLSDGSVLVIAMSPFFFILWALYRTAKTTFSQKGIIYYGIWKKKEIIWKDIKKIKHRFLNLNIELSNGETFIIYLVNYRSPDDVVDFISQSIVSATDM